MPFITLANRKIYYSESGTAMPNAQRGAPIVFVHGAAGSHLVWGNQVRALWKIARAVALDLPGHGRSEPPGQNTIDGYPDIILGLLDALKIDRAIIAGHSMGGAIAQALALSHPERVAGLVLIGTGARLRVLPMILDGVLNDFETTAKIVVDHSYSSALDATMRERALVEFRACPAPVTRGDFTACNAFDVLARLGDIRAPTLVICGKEDQMAPVKFSEFLASQIPQARLVLIDGAGHSVMLEQAEQVNQALNNFVSNL